MKKLVFLVLLGMIVIGTLSALTAGDIAIIAVHTDANKYVTLVALEDIPANSTVSLTDNAWNATTQAWRANEGTIVWTSPNSVATKGTVVTLSVNTSPYGADVGSLTTNTSFNLAASGDQVFMYDGTTVPTTNSSSAWIFAFSTESFTWGNNSNTSDVPTALTSYSVAMTTSTTEFDNAYFANGSAAQTTVTLTGDKATLLALFTDSSKYHKNDSAITAPTYSITVSAGGSNVAPQIANITQTPSSGITSSTTVSVSADVTDSDGTVEAVVLNWGTTSGAYPNNIDMTAVGDTYSTDTNIPAQTHGTIVYYVIEAMDNDLDITTSNQYSYTVNDPTPDPPTALSATAASHEGFTARWGAVSGATSYKIDVYGSSSGTNATDLFISEYYEGSTGNNKAIEIYNGTGATVDLTKYSLMKQSNGQGSFIDELTLVGTLANNDVYVVAHSASNAGILAVADQTIGDTPINFNGNDAVALYKNGIQIDVVGIVDQASPDWGKDVTLVRKSTISGPTTSYSINDWDSYAQDTATYLGSHTMGAAPVILTGWNDKTVNANIARVAGLDPSTDYQYVVRAVNAIGTSPNSNTISVTTTATLAGDGANTTIGGASTVVLVAPLTGLTDNTVEIDPNTTTNDDFSVVVTSTSTAITYSFTTINNLALNGIYQLNHVGMNGAPTNVSVSTGTIVDVSSDASGTLIEISGIAAKGTLQIIVEGDVTLPIELSSFTATINVQNFVNLMWITQSETGVSGYYVYRNGNDEISQAALISPLIAATNTSQQQSYIFTDNQLYNDGVYYYWLQNVDFDGTNKFHGPVVVNYSTSGGTGGSPAIPLITELKGIFPNPFNPTAQISYSIKDAASVNIRIYNSRGQIVRSIANAPGTVGNHRIVWDGRNDNGSSCSTGLYFVRMYAGKDVFTQKAMLVK